MIDVALATSAAPTFLPSHRLSSVRLVDGGVWANNPSMAALVEAVETCSIPLDQIGMLSIGTTSELKPRSSQLEREVAPSRSHDTPSTVGNELPPNRRPLSTTQQAHRIA
jgi:patatin-like phospholipase/acyl hydrolase